MRAITFRFALLTAFASSAPIGAVHAQGAGQGTPPTGSPPAAGAPRRVVGQPPRAGAAAPQIQREVEIRRQAMPGRGRPGQAMRGRGLRAGGGPATMVLALRGPLSLTPEQVKRLEALRDAPRPDGRASDLLRARADLMDAMKGEGNLSAARSALDKMAAIRTDKALAGLKARQEVRAVLTPAQKTMLDNLRRRQAGRAIANRRGRGGPGGQQRGGAMGGRGGRFGGQMMPPMGPNGPRGPMGGPGAGRGQQIIEERIINNGQEEVVRRQVRPPVPPEPPASN